MRQSLALILSMFLAPSVLAGEAFNVELGPQSTVIKAGTDGLNYFPDQSIAVLHRDPLTFLMAANNGRVSGTYVMQGTEFSTARKVATFLEPQRRSFDNGYAGCGAAYFSKDRNEWICLYHAEDHEGGKPVPYNPAIHSSYWSIGMMTVDNRTKKQKHIGQVLTGESTKADISDDHRGIGDVSIVPDSTGKYLYAYYTDLNRKARIPASICMARCLVSSGGRPGSWKKLYRGDFTQNGLGGKETPVVALPDADVIGPHVAYISELGCFLLTCNVVYPNDIQQEVAERSGIFWSYSLDGLVWSRPQKLVDGQSVPLIGKRYTGHPTFIADNADPSSVSGQLLYCFSPSWGTTAPHSPHFLVGRPLSFRLVGKSLQPPHDNIPYDAAERIQGLREKARELKFDEHGRFVEGDLTGVSLASDDVRALATLVDARRAILANTSMTDDKLNALTGMTHLEHLDLSQNPITDQAIPTLTSLKTLKRLNLNETKMTSAGVSRLRTELKGCQIAFDGTDSSATPSKDIVRLKLAMDEFGNCTVSVESTDQPLENATEFKGEVVKSSRLPKSTILNNKKGLVQLVHDFSKPDKFETLFSEALGKPLNARFDQTINALTLTSQRDDFAMAAYAYRFKPPFTVICDGDFPQDNSQFQIVFQVDLRGDKMALNLVSQDNGTTTLGAMWFETRQNKRETTELVASTEFSAEDGIRKEFRLPLPNAKIDVPCFVTFGSMSPKKIVQRITGLLIEGAVTPIVGIGFDERRGVIFTKQVVKGSLAELAGIQVGDVIVSINKEKPASIEQAKELLSSTVIGDTATLEIERAGSKQVITIKSE